MLECGLRGDAWIGWGMSGLDSRERWGNKGGQKACSF